MKCQTSTNLREIKKGALKKTLSTEVNQTLAPKSMVRKATMEQPEIGQLFQQLDQKKQEGVGTPDESLVMQSI